MQTAKQKLKRAAPWLFLLLVLAVGIEKRFPAGRTSQKAPRTR